MRKNRIQQLLERLINMNGKQFFFWLYSLFFFTWGTPVFATAGYFAIGYGPRSNAMAGATVAAPQDAMIGAVNPAGIALVGKRLDISFRAFNPRRSGSLDSRVVGGRFKIEDNSAKTWFFIPGAGLTLPITEDLWFGFTVYGNGGLNTSYARNIYDETAAVLGAFGVAEQMNPGTGAAAANSVPAGTGTGTPDTGRLGIDLNQAILVPTLSFKIHPKHSIGVSALIAFQNFEAKGLGNFQCFTSTGATRNPIACSPGGQGSAAPGFIKSKYLTDNGHQWSYGMGARIGWMGQVHPKITLGGAISSKIYMTRFDDYRELFAEDGGFDIPANFQVGIAIKPIESLQLAFDFQRIFYGDVKSIANKGPTASPSGPSIPNGSSFLGADNGLGFGWEDINIYRIGGSYQFNQKLTFRGGYSWNDSPIPNKQLLFNILAPAVITRHITAGMSYAPNQHSEWTLNYTHAFYEGQNQRNSAFGVPASFNMRQNSIDFGYSWKF